MSVAVTSLLSQIEVIKSCLSDSQTIDTTDTIHNKKATVYRSGIAILIFASIEAFIRQRSHEMLLLLDASSIQFSILEDKMQTALIAGAVKGLLFQNKISGDDATTQRQRLIGELENIFQTPQDLAKVSKYAYAHENSNVSIDEITNIFLGFGVKDSWKCITSMAPRLGIGGILDFRESMTRVASKRHEAAHKITTVVPHNDLLESLKVITGFAACFDIMLVESVTRRGASLPIPSSSFESSLNLRLIKPVNRGGFVVYDELIETSKTPQILNVYTTHADILTAQTQAKNNAKNNKQHFIELSTSGQIISW